REGRGMAGQIQALGSVDRRRSLCRRNPLSTTQSRRQQRQGLKRSTLLKRPIPADRDRKKQEGPGRRESTLTGRRGRFRARFRDRRRLAVRLEWGGGNTRPENALQARHEGMAIPSRPGSPSKSASACDSLTPPVLPAYDPTSVRDASGPRKG